MPPGIYKRKPNIEYGGFKKGHPNYHTEKSKEKISKAMKGRKITWANKISEAQRGEKGNNWKGGITPFRTKIWFSKEYKEWRMKVFMRDNWTCQFCGLRSHIGLDEKVYLEAHHIKSFKDYPKLRFDVNNGITLCRDCHNLTK